MKYKVNDRVRVKSHDRYYNNRDRIDEVACGNINFVPDMVKYCEGIVTISSILPTLKVYHIKEDGGMFNWTDEMFEGLVEEEMPLDKAGQMTDFEYEGLAYTLPEGYQFVDENGNVINATKIVLEKKKKEYPKTYEECCKILDITPIRRIGDIGYKRTLLNVFEKLLVCRDAYWKIAGEEMGLGKPWEPDYTDPDQDRYTIANFMGNIEKSKWDYGYSITFVFPTEEMRDAFYENFKELIEICKELL